MGIFSSLSALGREIGGVSNTRKAIFELRDRMRGTGAFSQVFYRLIDNVNYPPCYIEASQTGSFWSQAWIPAEKNYEPYTTCKFEDGNIAYLECCAIYLLIQECYPNVYDFPSNTTTQIENGATTKLVMKKQYMGKALKPAVVPPEPIQPQQSAVAPSQVGTACFCSACGTKLSEGAAFCSNCGKRV